MGVLVGGLVGVEGAAGEGVVVPGTTLVVVVPEVVGAVGCRQEDQTCQTWGRESGPCVGDELGASSPFAVVDACERRDCEQHGAEEVEEGAPEDDTGEDPEGFPEG